MKRKEIAKLFDDAASMMGSFAKCTVKHPKTGEKVGTITEDEIHAMILTLVVANHIIADNVEVNNPLMFAYKLMDMHAAVKYDLEELYLLGNTND